MKQWIKCLISAHEYEVLEKQDVKNVRGKISTKNVNVSSNI